MWDVTMLPWRLGKVDLFGLTLTLFWALSPLGGQASLRLLYKTPAGAPSLLPVRYLDTGPLGNIWVAEGMIAGSNVTLNGGGLPLSLEVAYGAALMQSSSQKSSFNDAWGNIKVPRIDRLNSSKADSNGWISVDRVTINDRAFTSLLGIPIVGASSQAGGPSRLDFQFETSHIALSCQPFELFKYSTNTNSFNQPILDYGLNVSCTNCVNWQHNDNIEGNTAFFHSRAMSFLGAPLESSEKAQITDLSARTIQFVSGIGNATHAIRASCLVTQHVLEITAKCDPSKAPACRADRIRRGATHNRSENLTAFDYWGTYVLDRISAASMRPKGDSNIWWSSPSELFLNDSSKLPIIPSTLSDKSSAVDLRRVSLSAFEDRAAMLLNTYLQIFMAPSATFADNLNLPGTNLSLSIYGPEHNLTNGLLTMADKAYWMNNFAISGGSMPPPMTALRNAAAPFIGASATASVTSLVEVYRVDWPWLTVLALAGSTLLAAGIAGIYLSTRTLAPDIFDAVTGLTIDNPYMKVADGGSVLGSTERVRLLRDVRVMVGDVSGDGHVGKIALGLAGNVDRLSRRRLYD
jgi:hypothetical protein